MRDPERIPRMLRLLEECWLKHPDQRLGQLVLNIIGPLPAGSIFFVEDTAAEAALRDWANRPPSVVPLGEGVVRYNGGVRCDMEVGPCACGAWHARTTT